MNHVHDAALSTNMGQLDLNTTDSSVLSASSSSSSSTSHASSNQHGHYDTLPTPWLSHCLAYLPLLDVVRCARAVSRHWNAASRTTESVSSCGWVRLFNDVNEPISCMSRGILDVYRCATMHQDCEKFVNLSTLILGDSFSHGDAILPRNIRDLSVSRVDADFWLHLRHSLPKLQRLAILVHPKHQLAQIGPWISEYETLTDIQLATWLHDLPTQLSLLLPLPRLRTLHLEIYHDEASRMNIDAFDPIVELIAQLTQLRKLTIYTHPSPAPPAPLNENSDGDTEKPRMYLSWLNSSFAKYMKSRTVSSNVSAKLTAAAVQQIYQSPLDVVAPASIDPATNPLFHLHEFHLLTPDEFDCLGYTDIAPFSALFGHQLRSLSLTLGKQPPDQEENHTHTRLSTFFQTLPQSNMLRVLHLTLHAPTPTSDIRPALNHLSQLTEFRLTTPPPHPYLSVDSNSRSLIMLLDAILLRLRNLEVLDIEGTSDLDDFSQLYFDLFDHSQRRIDEGYDPAPAPLTSLRRLRLHQEILPKCSTGFPEFSIRLKNYWHALGWMFPCVTTFEWNVYISYVSQKEKPECDEQRKANLSPNFRASDSGAHVPFPSVRHMNLHVDLPDYFISSSVHLRVTQVSERLQLVLKAMVRHLPKLEILQMTCAVVADLLVLLPDHVASKEQQEKLKKNKKKHTLPPAPGLSSLRHLIVHAPRPRKQRKIERDAECLAKFAQRGVVVTHEPTLRKPFVLVIPRRELL